MKTNQAGNTKTKRIAGTGNSASTKKSTTRSVESTPATEKVKARHTHGHGMNNEGTAVDYEEQR